MVQDHPVFLPPQDLDTRIWRYLDFVKLVALLDARALYFARSDMLGDPFEGSYSKGNIAMRAVWYAEADRITREKHGKGMSESLPGINKSTTQCMYVNCWHMNNGESAAMWKLYCQIGAGIAIRSTYRRLQDALSMTKTDIYLGRVEYVDYETHVIPEGNSMSPFVFKHESCRHENELRAVISKYPDAQNNRVDLSLAAGQPLGMNVDIDLEQLVEAIYIAPTAPPWFSGLVESVLRKFGLKCALEQSRLSEAPVY